MTLSLRIIPGWTRYWSAGASPLDGGGFPLLRDDGRVREVRVGLVHRLRTRVLPRRARHAFHVAARARPGRVARHRVPGDARVAQPGRRVVARGVVLRARATAARHGNDAELHE